MTRIEINIEKTVSLITPAKATIFIDVYDSGKNTFEQEIECDTDNDSIHAAISTALEGIQL